MLDDTKNEHTFNGILIDIYNAIYSLPLEYTPYYIEVRKDYIDRKVYAITLFYNYKKSHARIIFELDTKRNNHCYVHSIMNITKDMKLQTVISNCEAIDKINFMQASGDLDRDD